MLPDSPLDPVAAYDRLAPVFTEIAARRRAYLDAVDRLIINQIVPGSRTLLDIGAGDGSRARRIAHAAAIPQITLLEPSVAMSAGSPQTLPLRAESLHCLEPGYDTILCLWNVLGHIFPAAARVEVLRQCRRLLTPRGRVFIDVSHRYNIAHYGLRPTIPRLLKDFFSPHEANGDVVVRWEVAGEPCLTAGHVFTPREFALLCKSAGVRIEKRIAVDYRTGQVRPFSWQGNLLYSLRA